MKSFLLQKLGDCLIKLGLKLNQINNRRKRLHNQVNAEIKKVYKKLKETTENISRVRLLL